MIRPGLCSVTFRGMSVDEVIGLAGGAGLEGIEWGADVHVPPGDVAEAERVRRRCADAGLACPSYGTYLRVGRADDTDIAPIVDTAVALGATTVRVWATREATVDQLAVVVDAGARAGLTISTEFHPGTRTETAAGARELLDAVGGLTTYWQPVPGADVEHSLSEWRAVASRVTHLHVFWWLADGVRRPLVEGGALWPRVLAEADDGSDRWAHLEFVPDDDPSALSLEASVLRRWLT
jgi:sugar phosphate isomerase/epimerase